MNHPLPSHDVSGNAPAADVTPFGPVADTVGRPYIRPHRIAQAMRDEEMIAELAHKRLNAPPIHVRIGRTISRFFSSED